MKFSFVTLLLISFIYFQLAFSAPPEPSEKYANSRVLVEPDIYYLYWNYNKTDVVFEIQVKTTGWAGFGLSPNGGMDGSDVIVTWIDKSGKVTFSDRHIKDRSVLVDQTQNWTPIKVSSQNGYLVAKFTRKIKICDTNNEDRDIEPGSPYTIFAYGKNIDNGDISYHDGRGSKTLPLISSANSKASLDDEEFEITDFRIDSMMDNQYSTIYYCQVFQLPDKWTEEKRHLVKYETLYTPETKDHYDHWTITFCSKEFETVYLKNNSLPDPGYCVINDQSNSYWNAVYRYCLKQSLGWAVGSSDIQDFPENLAYPLGKDSTPSKYFIFQTHFNNPQKIPNLRDLSGVRFYTTTNYRKTEFEIFTIGTDENWDGLILPPNTERFEAYYGCSSDCVDGFFEEQDEIKIFAAFPHTHLTGKEVYLSVIRNDQEVAYIAENRYYDFEHQYLNFLTEPVTLKKGDRLKATCVYSTQHKKDFTYAGFTTQDEMCLVSFNYYPRTELNACYQVFDKTTMQPFFNKLAKDGDTSPINATESELDITILNKNADLGKKFQDFYAQADRIQICQSEKDFVSTISKAPTSKPMEKTKCIPSA